MAQPRPISLFTQEPPTHQKPYSFLVSGFMHVAVAGLILYGFIFANPRVLPFRPYPGWMRFFPVEPEFPRTTRRRGSSKRG